MYLPLIRPDWDYEHFPEHKKVLPERATAILIQLRTGAICCEASSKDNRPQHKYLFNGLTPEGHGYFAGNYRGESFPGLKYYEVTVRGDSKVGVYSSLVANAMNTFSSDISLTIYSIKAANLLPTKQLSKVDKLIYTVRLACKFFVEFLRIHPYANGNGHMGRYFIFSFLGVFGIWPKGWPLNDRPPDPPYSDLIKNYRNGKHEDLEIFVFRAVIGK
jgi:hypothetical protein